MTAKKRRRRASRADRETAAFWRQHNRRERALWVAEGRSLADYENVDGVRKWRRAKFEKEDAEMRRAWLRDHPGRPLSSTSAA